jgi:hypothetical protein
MRQMMRQLSGAGLFGAGNGSGGLKSKMMRRVAGMAGLPDMSGMMGGDSGGGGDLMSGAAPNALSPASGKKKAKKKARWKSKR